MSLALNVLSDLPEEIEWVLGGGTALALHLNHRESFDIDLFFEDPRALKHIANNPKTKQISSDWEFPGNYLKLIRPEGEIDFILASKITESPCIIYLLEGAQIPIESIEEIIAKKIKYRGSEFTLRDTFDLAAAIINNSLILQNLFDIPEIENSFKRVLQRIQFIEMNKNIFQQEMIIKNNKLGSNKIFEIAKQGLERFLK